MQSCERSSLSTNLLATASRAKRVGSSLTRINSQGVDRRVTCMRVRVRQVCVLYSVLEATWLGAGGGDKARCLDVQVCCAMMSLFRGSVTSDVDAPDRYCATKIKSRHCRRSADV